jgi:hypothetical protein
MVGPCKSPIVNPATRRHGTGAKAEKILRKVFGDSDARISFVVGMSILPFF